MKKNPCLLLFISLFFLPAISCRVSYQSQSLAYRSYRVSDSLQNDPVAESLVKPYRDSVNRTMNDVVGYADHLIERKELGKFMVDAYLDMAIEKFKVKVDAAFMNPGGIRLNQLPKGYVTNGKIYELMPFDNLLVLQKMKGSELKEFLDHIATKGVWPIAGLKMDIIDKKATNIRVADEPLEINASYTIANSDFVANGGEDAAMLKAIPQIINGYLVRDAIFDYIKKLKSQGLNIQGKTADTINNDK